MGIISVRNLKKYYSVHQKEPGFWGSIRTFLNRKYYDVKAVDGISFKIEEGELVGFIGPNGAGKTTTLKVLSGLLYPTSGRVRVLGYEPFKRQSKFQKQFSLIMGQKNQLWWDLPSWESFILNKEIYEISDEKFKQVVGDLSEMLEVKDVLNVQVRKLSLGQRMKCELIAALLHSPKVLFLDEPTIGLDVLAQKNMRDFIKGYNRQYGATIILTSHYMGDVKELCKRVIIINEGKILYDGSLNDIIEKFSTHKVIEIDFYNGIHQSFHVPRDEVTKKTYALLSKKNILDLTIEDPPIEDIVRQFFKHA